MTHGTTAEGSKGTTVVGHFAPLPDTQLYEGQVWHFTDAYAFVNIVENHRLWASAATVMNDPREMTHGAERIESWYKAYGDQLDLDARLHSLIVTQLKTLPIEVLERPAYVVSASRDFRMANQWQHYARASGVAIGLDPRTVVTPVNPLTAGQSVAVKSQWVEVVYDPAEQDQRIRRVLESLGERLIGHLIQRGQLQVAGEFVGGTLVALAASMKDPAFASEQEVRLISYLPQGQTPSHRATARGVIPYLEIGGKSEKGQWIFDGHSELPASDGQLPITAVRVGPPEGESERQRIIGVTSALRANGYRVPVNGPAFALL